MTCILNLISAAGYPFLFSQDHLEYHPMMIKDKKLIQKARITRIMSVIGDDS